MYRALLNKGFKPIYYTNDNYIDVTPSKSRLFYRLRITNDDLINSILNVLGKYDKYFSILLNRDLVVQIEIDEYLESFWFYLLNTNEDSFEICKEDMEKVINVLPNKYMLEHCEY